VEHFRQDYNNANRSPETALKLADTLVTKGDVIGVRGKEKEADKLYTEALSLCQQARDATPDDSERQSRVVAAWRDRSEHRMTLGDYQGALADSQSMLVDAKLLVKIRPDARSTYALASAYLAIANAHGYTKQLDEAHEEYLQGQALLQQLAADAPADKKYASRLADLDTSLGSNAEARGDFPGMLRHFTAWHDHVVKHYGRESDMYYHAAFRMGVAFQKMKRPAEAIVYLTDAVRIAEREVEKYPGHKGLLNGLRWGVYYLAEVHEALGNTTEVERLRQREKEVYALLAK
jgi:tetratricopeptide (TPR) repeat protein